MTVNLERGAPRGEIVLAGSRLRDRRNTSEHFFVDVGEFQLKQATIYTANK